MRPNALLALPLLILAACQGGDPFAAITDGVPRAPRDGPSAEARVADVAVRPDRVTFRLTDGARCVSNRPEGETGNWSGITQDCGYQLPFSVTFSAGGGDASRFTIEDSFGTLTPEGGSGPRAEVFVTDVDGIRKLFIRPLPARFFDVADAGTAAAPAPGPVAPPPAADLPPLPEAR